MPNDKNLLSLLKNIDKRLENIENKIQVFEIQRRRMSSSRHVSDKIKSKRKLSFKQAWIASIIQKYGITAHTASAYSWLCKRYPNVHIALGTYRSYLTVLEQGGVIVIAETNPGSLIYKINPQNQWIKAELETFRKENPEWERM